MSVRDNGEKMLFAFGKAKNMTQFIKKNLPIGLMLFGHEPELVIERVTKEEHKKDKSEVILIE